MKRFFYFVIIIFFCVLNGCNSTATPEPSLIFTTTPTRRNTSTPTKTAVITKTAFPSKIPHTATPTPISFNFLDTSLDNPGKWDIDLSYSDVNLPEIMIESPQGYYLDPSFKVSSIEIYYEWWGTNDPVFDLQKIERKWNSYWFDEKAVAHTQITSFLQSIKNLHPEPLMLVNTTHFDDYPTWTIELKSENDAYVLLHSESNTPDFSPWNVIYNGQIYSQFDGQIGTALSELVNTEEGLPLASVGKGGMEEGYSSVDAVKWPNQMANGFNGLLAIQDGFHYWTDPERGALYGELEVRSSDGGVPEMVIGSFIQLENIKIEVNKNQTVSCSIETLESYEQRTKRWGFECPVESEILSDTYYFPVSIAFTTDDEKSYTAKGNLFGEWEKGTYLPRIALPIEISEIINSSSDARDLLSDHQIVLLDFDAKADPVSGQMTHEWEGEIVLLGQIDVGERILEYSLTMMVQIKDSELIQWDIDRDELRSFLQGVLRQPITQNFLNADPNLVLNLYYGKGDNFHIGSMRPAYCEKTADSDSFSNIPQPIYGFSFNQSWSFLDVQIVLINGESRLADLFIETGSPDYSIWTSLLPKELVPINAPMFSRIFIWSGLQEVVVNWDENTEAESIEIYTEMVNTWNGPKEINSRGIHFESATLDISDDGRLELINCEKTP